MKCTNCGNPNVVYINYDTQECSCLDCLHEYANLDNNKKIQSKGEQLMLEDREWIAGLIITIVLPFVLGFCIGSFVDECIKVDDLAKVLYKDTDKYLQHKHDNFYDLLKLVKVKEVK